MLRRIWRRLSGNAVIAAEMRGQGGVPYLPRPRLEALRDRRVRQVVQFAARTVPHYREWFEREGLDPRQIAGAADLERLPILDRRMVRARPERFVAETSAARAGLAFTTSGTTGEPLVVRHDRRSLLANIAHGERERAPINQLCGGEFRPKEVYVGYETSTFKQVQAFYEENTMLPVRPRRRFVSLLEPIETVAGIVNTERPDILVGYGGWLGVFFRTVEARGLPLHKPRMVLSMGEALPHGARAHIEETLGLPLLSRYNAVEAFKIGFSCERRTGFHLHEDLCHVRAVGGDGRDVPPGHPGTLILSNLVNRGTVLLNYPIGDVGSFAEVGCPCGRTLRLLSELEGRVEDMLRLADGMAVHPRAVWETLKGEGAILQYQLTQLEARRFRLSLVTADGAEGRHVGERVLPRLRALLGQDAVIEIEPREQIERGPSGKFRAVRALG